MLLTSFEILRHPLRYTYIKGCALLSLSVFCLFVAFVGFRLSIAITEQPFLLECGSGLDKASMTSLTQSGAGCLHKVWMGITFYSPVFPLLLKSPHRRLEHSRIAVQYSYVMLNQPRIPDILTTPPHLMRIIAPIRPSLLRSITTEHERFFFRGKV